MASLPERIEPMLARSIADPFDSADHLFEIKWDGTRCIAFVERERLRLQNRRFSEMRERYPELAGLAALPAGTVLDSEVVVLDQGKPSFSKLMQREHLVDAGRIQMLSERLPATLMAFDLLYHKGRSIMAKPLRERRERLAELFGGLDDPHLIVPDYIVESGSGYFAAAEQHGLEGIMAKRLASTYQPGKRSGDWVKIKVARVEPFDILGYTKRESEPVISALLLGEPRGGGWSYKGNVGTGFTEQTRAAFFEALCDKPPLSKPPKDGPADAVWRATGMKCRVRFFEKTETGKLRGPVFIELVQ